MFYDAKNKSYWSKQGAFSAPKRSFNENTVRKNTLKELENPNTIYVLGGTPTYIHSSEIYWKAGLTTAENTLRKNLFKLADEQKRLMASKILFINSEWQKILNTLGMTWEEFKKRYTEIYNNYGASANPQYWKVLSLLRKMKTLKTTLRGIRNIKNEAKTPEERARKLIEAGFYAESDIEFTKDGKKIKKYINSETNIEYQAEQAYEKALQELINDPVYKTFREDQKRAIEGIIAYGDNGKKINPPSFDVVAGTLQEKLEAKVFNIINNKTPEEIIALIEGGDKNALDNYIASSLQGKGKNGLQVVNIAGENWGGHKKLNTNIFKADSFDVLTIDGKEISFFSTMKTGQVFDYASKYVEGTPPPVIERFTASLNAPEGLNFVAANDRTNVSAFHKKEGANIQKLMNYVYRNAVVAATSDEIKSFRDYTICYFVWLKLLNEIIGTPVDDYTIPIALKVHDNIYSTADILNKFINADALYFMEKGAGVIRKDSLQDFYTWKYAKDLKNIKRRTKSQKVLNPEGRGDDLYNTKTKAIEALTAFDGSISYKKLYTAIAGVLDSFAISKMKLPTFSTQLTINLDNIQRLLL